MSAALRPLLEAAIHEGTTIAEGRRTVAGLLAASAERGPRPSPRALIASAVRSVLAPVRYLVRRARDRRSVSGIS